MSWFLFNDTAGASKKVCALNNWYKYYLTNIHALKGDTERAQPEAETKEWDIVQGKTTSKLLIDYFW